MIEEAVRIRVPVAHGVELSVIEREAALAPSPARPEPQPVLLVHGLASNARMWDGVGEALGRLGHRSVAVDQRGHGRSDTPDTGYDFATLTADLVAIMDATGLERPIVAGQSWGAHVVLELGVRYPDRVSSVVCVDGGLGRLHEAFPDWPTAERAMTPPDLVGTPLVELEVRFRAWHPDWPESGITGALANFRVRDDGTVEPWLTRTRHMLIARQLWEHDPVALYPALAAPTLLLVAEPAGGEPRHHRAVDAIRAAAPGVAVEWVSPGDHDLHAQHPGRVAAAIARLAEGTWT